ncbi:DNA primase [Mycoplasmopsis arginini]|uniref:DNA primase n=1 Tax=Mycoplasmopsis arginini TaxID=2094 RepID=UPI00249E8B27|nr:DNA primase [Mycoplasmopsis arginini]MDI3351539.1 DNA primase [Mycoplasmopsis arginini]MDI3351979.1 DNA primase [Mycoplasmopsis arginini]
MIKENIWEFVISKSDIVNIVGQYVSLTKQGKNYKACCPFHGEKTPSFVVSPEKNIFKCFGCGKSGNAIKFIEFKENLSSIDALKFLAKKQNLDISQFGDFSNKGNFSNEHFKILEVNKSASNFFRYQITFEKSDFLKDYLKKRDLSDEIIKEFQIGFASKDKSIYDTLKEHQFDSFEIFNSSLVSNYDNKNFFNDRLIFPIHDEIGNIVAFSGRDITGLQNPKYLNSAETIVFKKNEVMFNYFHAKEEIFKQREVYLVEGQFDCIALHKTNIKNVVAIMGTSLSINHLKELSNKTITLFFDNDSAGKAATLKNLKIILYYASKYQINVKFVVNNLNKDPDEIYKLDQGITLKTLCENKIDIVEYLFNLCKENIQYNSQSFEKNKKFEEIFEYIYYVDKSLVLMLKEKLIASNILNKELFEYYLSNSKPYFPSDPFFKNKVADSKIRNNFNEISSQNIQSKNFDVNFDNLFLNKDNFQESNNIKQNLKINKQLNNLNYKKAKLREGLSSHYTLLKDILLMSLNQEVFIKQWRNDKFHQLDLKDESQKSLRKLITYIIRKSKQGYKINQNNLISFIENDIKEIGKTNRNDLVKEYKSYLEEAIRLSQIISDNNLNNQDLDLMLDKVDEFVERRTKTGKQILIFNKGEKNAK